MTPTSYGLEQAANETTPRWRERDLGMWVQSYAPFLDSIGLSASVALIPIVLVFVLLGVFKRPAHQATLAGLTAALVLAGAVWAMPPRLLMSAMLLGVAVALIPLLWTLVGAVWFINLLVHSGHFDIIRKSLTALTPDRRLQTILIGFGFLGLLEGLVAIGSPVAIGTAMLVGFGFPPITASVVALIGFSHPGVWGPMGLPIVVLQSVTTGIDLDAIGVMVGRQVPLLTLLCAPIMVVVVAGWRGLRGVWPITIATGLAFAIGTFTMSNYGTLYLAGSAGALAAILTTVVCLSIWKPKSAWRFPGEPDVDDTGSDGPALGSIISAWAPVGLLVVIMGGISGTPAREALTSLSTLSLTWPGLHDLVMRTPPVVPNFNAVRGSLQSVSIGRARNTRDADRNPFASVVTHLPLEGDGHLRKNGAPAVVGDPNNGQHHRARLRDELRRSQLHDRCRSCRVRISGFRPSPCYSGFWVTPSREPTRRRTRCSGNLVAVAGGADGCTACLRCVEPSGRGIDGEAIAATVAGGLPQGLPASVDAKETFCDGCFRSPSF